MSKRFYLVYDERAQFDRDEALILESLGEFETDQEAIDDAMKCWSEIPHVIYSYAIDGRALVEGHKVHVHQP